jgi:hypothetical protein
MTSVGRWAVVVLVAILALTTPIAVRLLPPDADDASPATVLAQARAALAGSWSGTVQTEGRLQLPDADGLGSISSLFGERTRMRVWWRDAEHWRVDRLLATGETDLVRDGDSMVEWSYERAAATVSREPQIRLPRPGDLLPPVLAERMLRGVADADATALPAQRLVGRSAVGLRVRPSSTLSSISHTDLWVDVASGVPLLLEVYAEGSAAPAVTSRFTDFSTEPVDRDVVSFTATSTTRVEFDDVLDIADAANQYAPVRPPVVVAGLDKTLTSDRAVGVYGEGMTQVIAIPLRDREADALRTQMISTAGAVQDAQQTLVTVGPLGVLLTGSRGDGGWLLAGTLAPGALERAGRDVLDGFTYVDDR